MHIKQHSDSGCQLRAAGHRSTLGLFASAMTLVFLVECTCFRGASQRAFTAECATVSVPIPSTGQVTSSVSWDKLVWHCHLVTAHHIALCFWKMWRICLQPAFPEIVGKVSNNDANSACVDRLSQLSGKPLSLVDTDGGRLCPGHVWLHFWQGLAALEGALMCRTLHTAGTEWELLQKISALWRLGKKQEGRELG